MDAPVKGNNYPRNPRQSSVSFGPSLTHGVVTVQWHSEAKLFSGVADSRHSKLAKIIATIGSKIVLSLVMHIGDLEAVEA